MIIVSLLVSGLILPNQGEAELKRTAIEEKHNDFYDAFLVLLDPYARAAINKKYPGRSYALWNADIIDVKRVSSGFSNYDFVVKVKYDTFTGPHNPPEGFVTITFAVNTDKVKVVDIKG